MSQPTSGDHRNKSPASRHQRSQHQGNIVPNPAGRVFVDDRSIEVRPFQDFPGIAHPFGERHPFIESHTLKEHCHRKSRDLTFGNGPLSDSVGEKGNLVSAQGLAVSFTADDLLR